MSTRQSSAWIVAIDGGGSKIAIAARLDDGSSTLPNSLDEIRTWSFPGTGSAHPGTWPVAQQNLADAVKAISRGLATPSRPVKRVVFALAGAGRQTDRARVTAWARTLPELVDCPAVDCIGDIEPLVDYHSGESGRASLAIILGTGSIVAAREEHGRIVRAGGWGPNLGDECSGGALGVAAMKRVVAWLDAAGPPSAASRLVSEIADQLVDGAGSGSPHPSVDSGRGRRASTAAVDREVLTMQLIKTAADRTTAAQLAHIVIRLALEQGDEEALQVLEPQIEQLAWQIEQVFKRAFASVPSFEIVMAGGLATNHPALQQAIVAACKARGLTPTRALVVDPLLAALRFAFRSAGA